MYQQCTAMQRHSSSTLRKPSQLTLNACAVALVQLEMLQYFCQHLSFHWRHDGFRRRVRNQTYQQVHAWLTCRFTRASIKVFYMRTLSSNTARTLWLSFGHVEMWRALHPTVLFQDQSLCIHICDTSHMLRFEQSIWPCSKPWPHPETLRPSGYVECA